MKEFMDVRTQLKYQYNEKDLFMVYVRRSNGKLKLLYCGVVPEKAFNLFYTFKIFKNDRKYLKIKPLNSDKELDILTDSGKDKKPDQNRGGKYTANYSKVCMRNISNIPETLRDDFKMKIDGIRTNEKSLITINKSIPLLMSYLVTLEREQIEAIFEIGKTNIIRHVILSGGDNTQEIKEILIGEQKQE